jgi:hypothetical protein
MPRPPQRRLDKVADTGGLRPREVPQVVNVHITALDASQGRCDGLTEHPVIEVTPTPLAGGNNSPAASFDAYTSRYFEAG